MKKISICFIIALFFITFQSCDFSNENSESDTAVLNVYLTDAPIVLDNGLTVEQVNVQIKRVDVIKKCEDEIDTEDGQEPDEDCVYTVLETDISLNLLDYADGVTYLLGSVTLEPGIYLQLRLVVDIEQSTIKFEGDDTLYYLQIPSGGQSGIKIKGNGMNPLFVIEEGEEADLVFDFDAQMSIKSGADKDNFKLLPVIKEVKFRNQVIDFVTE